VPSENKERKERIFKLEFFYRLRKQRLFQNSTTISISLFNEKRLLIS